MSALFLAILLRELRLAQRRPVEALLPVAFFIVAASLFPLGVGPEPQTLRTMAPGIAWVCALLASMLSVQHLYAADHADGSLDQMLLAPQSALVVAAAKSAAHWLTHDLPLIVAAPLVGLMFGLSWAALAALLASLAMGTPILSLLGGLGAALTLGLVVLVRGLRSPHGGSARAGSTLGAAGIRRQCLPAVAAVVAGCSFGARWQASRRSRGAASAPAAGTAV